MSFKTFTEWLGQKRDIFGFEKSKTPVRKQIDNEPFHRFDHEIVMRELLQHPLGSKKPSWDGCNVITWGDLNLAEAIHMEVSPLGSFKVIIRKQVKSLIGENVWICKKVKPLPDQELNKNEQDMASLVVNELDGVDHTIDSAGREYNLEVLTMKLADAIRRKQPCEIMYFDRIRKKNENNYLITMNIKGYGVEAPGQMRVEQFHITMFFDKEAGLIRSYGNDISSRMSTHDWIPQPSEWDENFAPTQSHQEIIEAITNAFSTY